MPGSDCEMDYYTRVIMCTLEMCFLRPWAKNQKLPRWSMIWVLLLSHEETYPRPPNEEIAGCKSFDCLVVHVSIIMHSWCMYTAYTLYAHYLHYCYTLYAYSIHTFTPILHLWFECTCKGYIGTCSRVFQQLSQPQTEVAPWTLSLEHDFQHVLYIIGHNSQIMIFILQNTQTINTYIR